MSFHDKKLLDRTFEMLDASKVSLPELAAGADVGVEWLKKLRARNIGDPSVRRIQRLHDFLVSGVPQRESVHEHG